MSTSRTQRQRALIAHVQAGLSTGFDLIGELNAHHAKTLELIDTLKPGDFSERRVGRLQLAAQYGILDARRIPLAMVQANGDLDPRHIDGRPRWRVKARRDDPHHYGHSFPEIPQYEAIPSVVELLAGPTNRILNLRDQGIEINDDGAADRLSDRIRGVQRALFLFHLWNGDNVSTVRFTRKKRKAGDIFTVNPRWYHPTDIEQYRNLASVMHADGLLHADASAYLHALSDAWSALKDGREHVGSHTLAAIEALLDVHAEAA
ncbi:MAG: hypothetical protein ACI8RZ_008009 [Myxococcota bacterium]|jgi:hypothetical protein